MGGVPARTAYAEGDSQCPSGIWVDCALYVPHLASTLERNNTTVYTINYAGSLDPGWSRGNEQFAGAVGGRWLLKDDLATALAQAAADAQGGYTIAYEQPREGWDNKYHIVKLICSRKGVNILARQRYYEPKDNRDPAAREQGALAAAFNTPGNVSDIGLRVSLAPGAKANSLRLKIVVDAADLLLARHGEAYDGYVTVSWVNYGDAGPVGTPGMSHPTLHFAATELGAATKNGVPILQDVPIDGTIKAIRLFVVDRTTCLAGSLFIPLGR